MFRRKKGKDESNKMPKSIDELNNLEKLAWLAYQLFGEGPVDPYRLRYEFVNSPLFAHIEGDWFVKSIAYVILSTDVLEERDGKYYIKKEYIERLRQYGALPKEATTA